MKITYGIIALFTSLGLVSGVVAQTNPKYSGSAGFQTSNSSSHGGYYESASTTNILPLQDVDQALDSGTDDDDRLLTEEAISEQLKQLNAKNQELEKAQEKLNEKLESFDKFEESLEEQQGLIDDIDESLFDLVSNGHGDQSMELFGRIHIDHWSFPDVEDSVFPLEGGNPQDRFNFRRMRIGVKGDVNDNMIYKIEMEFAEGNNPSYRDAFLGFKHLPLFNEVKIGNQKRPYGLDHWNSSRYNVFIERPAVIESFNQDSRRLGISSWGYTDDLRYSWQYGVYNYRLTQNSSGAIGDHYQPEFASRFAITPWYDECSGGRGYAHIGLSGSFAFPNGRGGALNDARYRSRPEARSDNRWVDTGAIVGANKVSLVGLEGVFNAGPLQIVGEYQFVNVDRTGFVNSVQLRGGYVYASYFLTGEHIPWDRKTGQLGRVIPFENFWRVRDCNCMTQGGMGAWQVAARLSNVDLIDENINGGDATALTLGLNWHWNPYARMQFNYIFGDVKRDPLGSGDYQIFGTRFMIDF